MAKYYNVKPSTFLDIIDPYTSFCFDEACAYISSKIQDGEEANFKVHFKSFKELYNHYK